MLSKLLRPIITTIFTPFAKVLQKIGITPDMITITGTILTSFVALWLIPNGHLLLGAVLIGVFALFDLMDGILARLSGSSGPWGAFLDSTLDRVADGAIFTSIALFFILRLSHQTYDMDHWVSDSAVRTWWPRLGLSIGQPALGPATPADLWGAIIALACIVLGAVVPYCRARAGAFGVDANSGVFERPARLLLGLAPLLLLQFGLSHWILVGALAILALGSLTTVIQRMLEVKRALATGAGNPLEISSNGEANA